MGAVAVANSKGSQGIAGLGSDVVAHVLDLHRHRTGYVTIGQYTGDAEGEEKLSHRLCVLPQALEQMLPYVADALLRDGAVSINACAAPRQTYERGKKNPRLFWQPPSFQSLRNGSSAHNADNLRFLNACYVDLDCYRLEPRLSPDQALRLVEQMVEEGSIPVPSLYAMTGRGLWVLWYLHRKGSPTQSHLGGQADEILRLKSANRELAKRLRRLGADQGAVDATRFLSLHGSVRSTTGRAVEWHPFPNRRSYELHELCRILGIENIRTASQQKALSQLDRSSWGGGAEYTERAWEKSASNRLSAFTILQAQRGGFDKGMRGAAAFVYAKCLVGKSRKEFPRDKVLPAVQAFGRTCRPALSPSKCASAVKSAFANEAQRYLSYQEMADMLDIKPHEAALVSQMLGNSFPPARAYGVRLQPPAGKGKIEQRHSLIRTLDVELGVPSENGQ